MDLTQIKEQDELTGKTIQRVAYTDNRLFFFFTDNTFCISRGCGWESRDVEIMDETYDTKPNDWNLDELKEVGILDEQTFNRLKFERQNRRDAIQKQKDLEKLEELKRKYNA